MCTRLDNPATLENHNAMGIDDALEFVRHENCSSILHCITYGRVHLRSGRVVKSCMRLIK